MINHHLRRLRDGSPKADTGVGHWTGEGEPQKGNAQKVNIQSPESGLKGDFKVISWLDPLVYQAVVGVPS